MFDGVAFPVPYPFRPPEPPRPGPDEVPARVLVAAEFLEQLARKTAAHAAVGAVSVEVLPGQQLTGAERNAQAKACFLLAAYFEGKLKPDWWERRAADECETPPGTLLNCFNCHPGPPKRDCTLCRGSGNVLVTPAGR